MAFRFSAGAVCNRGSAGNLIVLSAKPPCSDRKYRNKPNSRPRESRHATARATANLPTAHALTSVSSCPPRCWLFSSMCQRLLQLRFVKRHQGPLLQLRQKVPQPDPDQPHGSRKIHPAQAERLLAEIRRHEPIEVYQSHTQNEDGDARQQPEVAFQIAGKQQREGQREMSEDQCQCYVLPPAVQSRQVPGDLFRQVARPNNQELGKREVGPTMLEDYLY